MKVLMLTSSYPHRMGDWRGGFVRELGLALMEQGLDVEVAAPNPGTPPEPDEAGPRVRWLPALLKADGRAFHGFGIEANLRADPLAALTLPRFLLAFAAEATVLTPFADVIVAHWLVPMGAVGAMLARFSHKPLVVVAHSAPSGLTALPPLSLAVREVVRAASLVVCVCDRVRDLVLRTVGKDLATKVRTLPLGVAPRPRVAATNLHGLRLLFVGRLVGMKGADLLIRACAGLEGVRVTFVGDGPEASRLRSLAASLEAPVRFVGECDHEQVLALMSSHDALVVPSRRTLFGREEGLPRVAVEAWASGLPVIASDSGGIAGAAGDSALIFRSGDMLDLRRQIVRLRDDEGLRQRLRAGSAGLGDAMAWHNVAPGWVELLASVARRCP